MSLRTRDEIEQELVAVKASISGIAVQGSARELCAASDKVRELEAELAGLGESIQAEQVWILVGLDETGHLSINGAFNTRASAEALCRTAEDAVVPLDLGRDYTDERTFRIIRPLAGADALVTA